MYEKMEKFLAKQLEMINASDDPSVKKTHADQAFGGLSFAIQMCGENWDEANRYVDVWSKVWYAKFTKAVYGYDVEG